MAVSHIGTNEATYYGRLLKNVLTNMQLGTDGLGNILATMSMMIDGDGSLDAHYTYITSHFGFADDATSHAAFDELNSCYLKINVDTSVTNVKSAIAQVYSKFR